LSSFEKEVGEQPRKKKKIFEKKRDSSKALITSKILGQIHRYRRDMLLRVI